MPTDIEEFFASYVSGFDQLDAQRIASHYVEAPTIIDALGRHRLSSRLDVVEKLASYCAGFEEQGYAGARFVCDFYQALGEDACFVDLRWFVALKNSALDYKTAYTLHKSGPSWRIGAAMVYDYSA